MCEGCLDFEKRDLQILAVVAHPPDRIQAMVKNARKHGSFDPANVPYPLCTDPAGMVGALYGVAYQFHTIGKEDEPAVSHRPATFFIDKQGVIRFEHRSKNITDRASAVQLLAILDRLAKQGPAGHPLALPLGKGEKEGVEKPRPPAGGLKRRVNPVDGAAMVYVPAGKFKMGGGPGHKYGLGLPEHEQAVEGCWVYTTEVTNRQYRKFLDANPQWSPERLGRQLRDGNYLAHWRYLRHLSGDEQPVVFVSWHAAQAYAKWAGGRLPSEAEWEYAARAGKQLDHATADGQIGSQLAHFNAQSTGAGLLEKDGPIPAETKAVGRFPPNPWGLHDMAGNVWEWCRTPLRKYPYVASDLRDRPEADEPRVVRGGSWFTDSLFVRTGERLSCYAAVCTSDLGFRCIVPEQGE